MTKRERLMYLVKKIPNEMYCRKIKRYYDKVRYLSETNFEKCCKFVYKKKLHKKLNLSNPQTFNEKIQWLKVNEILPNLDFYTKCADKYAVRSYVQEKGYNDILVDLIGVYKNPDDIIWSELPQKFVLKINDACGFNIICSDKSKLDENIVKKQLKNWLSCDYWLEAGEIQYKNIPKKILCEKFIESENGSLTDYKFYCYNGTVTCVMLCIGRGKNKPMYINMDRERNLLPYNPGTKKAIAEKMKINVPENLDRMFDIASELSKGFPFVRVDLYNEGNKIYFGELTFTPCAGLDKNMNELGDREKGKLIKTAGS